MLAYLVRRLLQAVLTLVIVSIISFIIIELPPGNYLTVLQANLEAQRLSETETKAAVENFRARFGLDEPFPIRYWRWVSGLLRGDLGYSMALGQSANQLIGERLALTMTIAIATLLFTLVVAIPIGVLSAVRQYSPVDYLFTFVGFVGLAVPNFLLALVLMYLAVFVFDASSIGGLFSPEYVAAPWSLAKIVDLGKHLWLPVIIVGMSGTAGTIRVVRGQVLSTLGEPFIRTARMKGLPESRVISRHALRAAMNPVISGLGLSMPNIISGETLTAVVLSLSTIGPLLLTALLAEDISLAGSILVILTAALVVGNFLADIALAWLDPRIRLDGGR